MIDGIEAFYHRIAQAMIDALPDDWSVALFEAIFHPKGSVYEAEYVRASDGVARGFQPSSDGSKAFRQLRNKFQEAGQPLWGRACFTLRPDGTFNMKWGYDNCDARGFALFDADEELARHEARRQRLTRPDLR